MKHDEAHDERRNGDGHKSHRHHITMANQENIGESRQPSCLQQTVGVMITAEEKQKLMMEYDYQEEHATTPAPPMTTASTSSGSEATTTTSSGGALAKLIKKEPDSKVHKRELKQRTSEPVEMRSVSRELSQDLDAAAADAPEPQQPQMQQPLAEAADEELITDEQMSVKEETPPWMMALKAMMDSETANMKSALGVTSERIANLETHKHIEQRFQNVVTSL